MTANHTPKLSLMSPVDSDAFAASDYADTFAKIDAAPGLLPVANYSALQALGWGTNQHGRKAIQLDNLAEWIWINPSGSGTFKRTNSLGLLNNTSQTSDVSTSATSGLGVRAVQTGNITGAGGRYWHVCCDLGLDNTVSQNSKTVVSLTDNGTTVQYSGYVVGAPFFAQGNHFTLDWFGIPTPGSVHNFALYVRSAPGSPAVGAQGTSSARGCQITVLEV